MAIPVWVIPAIAGAGAILKWLSNSRSNDNAMDSVQSGFDQANKTIRDATAKSFEYLDPYLTGGREDYDRYRHLSQSGYYDTPYSGSYQPQAFQNQSVMPGAANRGTMSFGSNYQPMQFQQMGLLSSPALPTPPPMPIKPPATPPVTPGGPTGLIPTPGLTPEVLQKVLDANRNNTLGDNALPNKGFVPHPNDPTSQVYRNPTQPLTREEIDELMRRHIRTGPTVPYPGPTGPYSGPMIPGGR